MNVQFVRTIFFPLPIELFITQMHNKITIKFVSEETEQVDDKESGIIKMPLFSKSFLKFNVHKLFI